MRPSHFLAALMIATAASSAAPARAQSNNPPVITEPGTVSGPENSPITVTASAIDPDGQDVTLSQTNFTSFFPNSSSSGPAPNPSITLTGTPGFSDAGSYPIDWTATDSNVPAGTATATTVVLIGGPNRAPVVLAPFTAFATEGVPFSITASASDPDGENVTLCVTDMPGFLTGPSCSGPSPNPSLTVSGTPGSDDAGNYIITWYATDPSGFSSTVFTSLTVADSETTPVLDPPFPMTVNEGETATQQLTASDAEGDPLTFFKSGSSPLFMTVSAAGLVTLAPGFADAGGHTGTVSVTDGVLVDTKSFPITVVNVNRCPTANAGGPYVGVMFAAVAFDGTASSDPDGAVLSYAWDFGDGTTGAGATTSHTYTLRGTFTVTLTVDDGACASSATTTAEIGEGFTALAFTTGGNDVTNLGSGKPFTCVEVEPVAGSFDVANVDVGTVKMVSVGTGSVSEIFADAGKTSVGGDKNGNGAIEIHACFTKADLRVLFGGLPAGQSDVAVTIEGSLLTGGTFRASLTMTVKATGGALAARLSPNPMNPSAKASFTTRGPGAVKVQLYDLAGRLVRTYLDERRAAGTHEVTMDGRTAAGRRLASGVYFVKFWSERDGSETKRLTILQ